MFKTFTYNKEILLNSNEPKLDIFHKNMLKYIISTMVFKDMLFFFQIWRQIKGYSKNNQRTHSNNKSNKKKKILNYYRLQQFYKLFGRKRRDIFPTLIIAEYTNRLWFINWKHEWDQAWKFIVDIASKNRNIVKFDPHMLSKNIITGVKIIKKKKNTILLKKK